MGRDRDGVDSGASETVVPPDEIKNVPITQGEQARKGVKYLTASGDQLPNLGEKDFVGANESGIMRHLTAQVADVNQPLLAVRKIMKSGHRIVFDDDGSYIEDKGTGDVLPMRDDGSMFLLKLWCRRPMHSEGDAATIAVTCVAQGRQGFLRQE